MPELKDVITIYFTYFEAWAPKVNHMLLDLVHMKRKPWKYILVLKID